MIFGISSFSGLDRTENDQEFLVVFKMIVWVVEGDFADAPIGSGQAGEGLGGGVGAGATLHRRTSVGPDLIGAGGGYGYGTSVWGAGG